MKKTTVNRVRKLKTNKCQKKKKKVHKVLIVGDSHARGCAAEVKLRLDSEYEVIGFANPVSTMKAVKESTTGKIDQLTKEDIVLWGGSNDVAKNISMSGMKHILDLVINATHTNVIQLSVPHRHELIIESCVNREVKVFNNNLRNRLKRFNNVEMTEVTSEREVYTKHGQHLNSRGKEIMANKIALSIENVLKRKVDPIRMKWHENDGIDSQKHVEPTHEESASDGTTTDNNLISKIMEKSDYPDINNSADKDSIPDNKTPTDGNETNRSSNRTRKIPASR